MTEVCQCGNPGTGCRCFSEEIFRSLIGRGMFYEAALHAVWTLHPSDEDKRVRIYEAAEAALNAFADNEVRCIVTSPTLGHFLTSDQIERIREWLLSAALAQK